MNRIFLIALGGYIALNTACSPEPREEAQSRLQAVIREIDSFKPYERAKYPLGLHTEAHFQQKAEFASAQLSALEGIDPELLSETDRISAALLKFVLQEDVDFYQYRMHWNPIQADQGFHLDLNYRIRPINSTEEARQYLRVLGAVPEFTRQHLALLRKGLEAGISQPKVIFQNYAATYDQHITEVPDESPFFGPINDLTPAIGNTLRDSIHMAARKLISDSVVPAFREIKAFFENEYIPKTREAIGLSSVPGGKELYQNRINYYTTGEGYTAETIHEIGLKEVERIQSAMQGILQETGYEGDLVSFMDYLRSEPRFYASSGEELLKEARDIAKRIDEQLPAYFKTLPRKPYGVKKVPDALAPIYTAGRYSPPGSETQPGYYLVNTYKLDSRPLYVLPSLTAHEAVPGHHLQGSLNRELGDSIPEFRKKLYLSAYGEGWALYTETLAQEMGIYRTPYERFGKLTYEMWRACRLVVDTGIHAMGWSREQVIQYMREHTALSLHEIQTETDRYIGWPGQALSYKMGELKIIELRQLAERSLGTKFDLRDFHEMVLSQGTVTLPLLEQRIQSYINQKMAAKAAK